MGTAMLTRRELLALLPGATVAAEDKCVVLTFDDAVKSHRSFVAPLLKDLGFNATFFITHRWMDDAPNFLTWAEVAEIHAMGFEIGNHSWTHANFSTPKAAARLEAELSLVEAELKKVAVPKPVSFAWCGNAFSPEALAELGRLGYQYARRGMQPEVAYGEMQVGPAYEPLRHDRLLIPTTGDAYPKWTIEHFEKVIAQAAPGRYAVLQFHGVPDVAHPWVHTPPEMFEKFMRHLKAKGFRCIAMNQLGPVAQTISSDPIRRVRYPEPKIKCSHGHSPKRIRYRWPQDGSRALHRSRATNIRASVFWKAPSLPCAAPRRWRFYHGIRIPTLLSMSLKRSSPDKNFSFWRIRTFRQFGTSVTS